MLVQSFELTQSQLRLLETGEQIGNRSVVFRIQGFLKEEELSRAILRTLKSCQPFQFRFLRSEDGYRILQSENYVESLKSLDARSEDESLVFSLIESLCRTHFRVDAGAPYQFTLVRGKVESYLVFVCHPVVIDRFSLRPLFSHIAKAYNDEQENPLMELGLNQSELLKREAEYLHSPLALDNTDFWMKLVRDANFEWRPPRMEGLAHSGPLSFSIAVELKEKIAVAATQYRMGIDRFLRIAFQVFLSKMTRNEVILTSYFHRIHSGRGGMIGFNENKLALKSVVDQQMDIRTFFSLANRLCERMDFHSNIPARTLAHELSRFDPGFKRVTNVLFDSDPMPYDEFQLRDLKTQLLSQASFHLEGEDIAVHYRIDQDIRFRLYYRNASEVEGLQISFQNYLNFLSELVKQEHVKISDINMHNADTMMESFHLSDGGEFLRPPVDVMTQFFETAHLYPDQVAIKFRDRTINYLDLAREVLEIAQNIRQKNMKGQFIAIGLDRSERYIKSILGILASGNAYLPLDPEMSPDRVHYILDDSKPAFVIVEDESKSHFADYSVPLVSWEEITQASSPPISDEDLDFSKTDIAYMIYTSGTTGRPKGVMITRQNLATLMASLEGVWERGPGQIFLQFAAFTFDASVLSVFNPIIHGATVVITPSELRADPVVLYDLIKTERITNADLPPALMPLLPKSPLPDLQVIVCGGEAIEEESVRFWSKVVSLCNCYGPTETTVMASMTRLGGYKSANNLGRPLPGYHVYIIEDSSNLAPLGAIGEIAIGGNAVALGYLHREDLTKEKFRPDPRGGGKIYMTGDLGRFLPNGDIEFLGRSDFQVKIRGFRIELSEIESVISDQAEVHSCHVAALEKDGQKILAAWYVGPRLKPPALRERIAKFLPSYMVPPYLIAVPFLPLTSNRKVDRRQLLQQFPLLIAESSTLPNLFDSFQQEIRAEWAVVLKIPEEQIHLESHFFALGGHSLLVSSLCATLSTKFNRNIRPRMLFEFPVFRDFCEKLKSFHEFEQPLKAVQSTHLRESRVTSRMLSLMHTRTISNPDDNTYNIVSTIDLSGKIDLPALKQALQDLFSGHPIFRYVFFEEHGELHVREIKWEKRFDIQTRTVGADEIPFLADEMRKYVFGMTKAPLWQMQILQHADAQNENRVTLLFAIHHSIFDGWSLNLFTQELTLRYKNILANETTLVNPCTWIDYFETTEDLRSQPVYKKSIDYWRAKLTGTQALVELPYDRQKKISNSNLSLPIEIPVEVVVKLKKMADDAGVTLSPLLFSVYLTWIWRLTGQPELTVGYPYAGRDWPGSQEIYGAFIVVGYLRVAMGAQKDFLALAQEIHKQMINDKDHLFAAPFEAGIPGQDEMNVMFSLQTGIHLDGEFGEGRFFAEELPTLTSKGDLSAIFYENSQGGISGRLEFDGSLFLESSMKPYLESFHEILTSLTINARQRIGEIKYLTIAQSQKIQSWSIGPNMAFEERTIFERFYQVARQMPQREALFFQGAITSYKALYFWQAQIGELLLAEIDKIDPQMALIGFAFEKSDLAVASLLAILGLGRAYVPLDLTYPDERIRYFCENTQLKLILADEAGRSRIEALKGSSRSGAAGLGAISVFVPPRKNVVFDVEASFPGAPQQEIRSLAYVIHTSGSTGKPKGVLIENRSVVRMIQGAAIVFGFGESSRSTLLGPFGFDTSVLEIFLALLTGGRLAIVPEEVRKVPAQVHEFVKAQASTHLILSPALLQNFPQTPIPSIEFIGFGGDTVDEKTANYWSRQTQLFSCYGPTETTVQSSAGVIKPGGNSQILGKPSPGYSMYLLDSQKQPVIPGTVGEIYIGGEQSARGYIHLPQMTQERFIQDSVRGDLYSTMYRTGDLGRFLEDGVIEFLGRNDLQIKLRGYRIELGEIESRLLSYPGVQQAVVTSFGEGEQKYLVAYYRAAEDFSKEDFRTFLLRVLPDYMVPAFYVRLESFPITNNGKIDRKALPAVSDQVAARPPNEGLETQIAKVWESVLRFKGFSRDESFFEIGGNSLLAIRMQSELREQLGIEFSMSDFYGHPTIEGLSAEKQSDKKIDFLAMAIEDSKVDLLALKTSAVPAASPARTILLTGGNGFLGTFLLAELIAKPVEKIYVLLRTPDVASGRKSIEQSIRNAGLNASLSKIEIVIGDLSKERLGMTLDRWHSLSGEVDAILHCGAYVHHLQNYAVMKPTNVLGTIEVIKFAMETKIKSICYVSTLSVGAALEGVDKISEAVLPNRPLPISGYILTKWVSEQILMRASRELNLSVAIARPGNITGKTVSGFTNYEQNHFWLFNKGCLQLGMYPQLRSTMEMMPVDVLAHAVVLAALDLGNPQTERKFKEKFAVLNLYNPKTLSQDQFFQIAQQNGFSVRAVPIAEWQKALSKIDGTNALSAIKDFYKGELTEEVPMRIEEEKTLQIVRALGADLEVDAKSLAPVYLNYLLQVGFLKKSADGESHRS